MTPIITIIMGSTTTTTHCLLATHINTAAAAPPRPESVDQVQKYLWVYPGSIFLYDIYLYQMQRCTCMRRILVYLMG